MRPVVEPRLGAWSAVGVNERFLCYRYNEDNNFKLQVECAYLISAT